MKWAVDYPLRRGACEGCEGVISIGVWDPGEATDGGAWETDSDGGVCPRPASAGDGCHEVTEIYVDEEGWGTWNGQDVCLALNADRETEGTGLGVDGEMDHGEPWTRQQVRVAHPSLVLLGCRFAGPSWTSTHPQETG
jgi:hypothetical protein